MYRSVYEQQLRELLEVIDVAPFSIEHFGINFVHVLREPVAEDAPWNARFNLEMTCPFSEPWDNSEYDT